MDIADQDIDARNVGWSLNYLQTKHDLLPCQSLFRQPSEANEQSEDELSGKVLGKRKRALKTLDADRIQEVESQADVSESKAYPFLFLEHAQTFPGSTGAVEQIQQALKVRRLPN